MEQDRDSNEAIAWDRMDRSIIEGIDYAQLDDDADFWLRRSPEERFAAIEHLRRLTHGDATINARLQRVFEAPERGED